MNRTLRNLVRVVNRRMLPCATGPDACGMLQDALSSNCPAMVARLGAVEVKSVLYTVLPPPINIFLRNYVYKHIHTNAGFFPVDEPSLKKFGKLMVESMMQVDVLASWRPEEIFFRRALAGSRRISINDLDPTVGKGYSWTSALAGKRVLVVHPFAKSIARQYRDNRARLFADPGILPEFKSLETVEAVQTIAGNTAGFNSWFDALEHMEAEIAAKDFDVALIGCGAYGFPLAAFVKGLGRQAVHLGGVLQIYFGIKGKRWDGSGLYNEHWISPSSEERPRGLGKVEEGCYW